MDLFALMYRLADRDRAGVLAPIALITRPADKTQNASNISQTWTNDLPRIAVIQNMTASFSPSAAITTIERRFDIMTPDSAVVPFLVDDAALGAAVASSLNWQGIIIVPPRWQVRAAVTFGGAAANNAILGIGIHGYHVPVGNILLQQ